MATSSSEEIDEIEAVVKDNNTEIVAQSSSDGAATESPKKSSGRIVSGSSSSDGIPLGMEMGPFGFPVQILDTDTGTDSQDEGALALHAQRIALGWHEWNLLFSTELTKEELDQGFKWLSQPNPRYLGFVPSKKDKRKFLNAQALVWSKPENSLFCYLPVSTSQRWSIVLFVGIFALVALGVVFYFRQISLDAGGVR